MLLFFIERFEFLATDRGLDRNRWDCVSTCVQENDGLVGSILKILEESVQIDVVVVVAVAVLVVGFVAATGGAPTNTAFDRLPPLSYFFKMQFGE